MAQKLVYSILVLILSTYAAAAPAVPSFFRTVPAFNSNNGFQPCSNGEEDTFCLDVPIKNADLRSSIEENWKAEPIGPQEIQSGMTALGYFGKDTDNYYLVALTWTKDSSQTKVILYGPQSQLLLKTLKSHTQNEMEVFMKRLTLEASLMAIQGLAPVAPTSCSEIKNPSKEYASLFINTGLNYQKLTDCFLRIDDDLSVYVTMSSDKGVHLISAGDLSVTSVDALPDIRDLK